MKNIYLAADLGAGSGRVIACIFDGKKITLEEISRFDNTPVDLPSGLHWNITGLFGNIVNGIKLAIDKYGDDVKSVAVDTWGVDYVLLDKNNQILGLPYIYRDSRTDGYMQKVYDIVGKKELYDNTGIQFMFFNSIYQLKSHFDKNEKLLKNADSLLFIPDYLNFCLSGVKAQEETIVSTSQLYDTGKRKWAKSIIKKLSLPTKIFGKVVKAPFELGKLRSEIASYVGKSIDVICVAGHDTGSAVAAVPTSEKNSAWLSSGTWSIMGLEVDKAIINDESYKYSFTNELGLKKTVRFSKNICGLWLMQECKRYWESKGEKISYSEMCDLAATAKPFQYFINPDDDTFAKAGNMPEKICIYVKEIFGSTPKNKAEILRCIYDSLSLRYKSVFNKLCELSGQKPETLHIIGGGSKDDLLNQFTANALGISVEAGPVEATSLGNAICQMMSDGTVNSLKTARKIIKNSFEIKRYSPQDVESFNAAYQIFEKKILK